MNIAIASGKGGTGKTFVATNLFWVAQSEGHVVTLVDCDAEEPNVSQFLSGDDWVREQVTQRVPTIETDSCQWCGRCHAYCYYNAIVYLPDVPFIQVVDDLCHACGACSAACEHRAVLEYDKPLGKVSSSFINPFAEVLECRVDVGIYSPVPLIKKALSQLNSQYINMLDAPPGIACPFIATVNKADYVLLVAEPTPFGLHDLELSVETLRGMNIPFGVVLNRAGMGDGDALVLDWLKTQQIDLLSTIPFSRDIASWYAAGVLPVTKDQDLYGLFAELFKSVKKKIHHE